MGGGGQGAGGSGQTTGGSATVYEPKNQGAFDTSFSTGLNNLFSAGGDPSTTIGNPPATLYSGAADTAGSYLFPSTGGYASTAANTATTDATAAASDYYKGTYPTLTGAVAPLGSYGAAALNTGSTLPQYQQGIMDAAFDPQRSLYNKDRAQVADYANVANSMAGIGSSPYGASVATGAMSNFDLDWNNKQLDRMGKGVTDVGNLATAYGNYGKAGESAYTTAGSLGYGAGQGLSTLGYSPYYYGSQIGDTALKGYSNLSDFGLSSYKLPEDALKFGESYLGLGQTASGISSGLGNTGYNQTASGVGGALSGANSLFGTNSLLGGSSGIFGSGGLFGSSGGAASGVTDLASAGSYGGGLDLASLFADSAFLL